MRTTITIFTMLFCTTSYGQFDRLKGTWVSDSSEVIVVNNTSWSSRLYTEDKYGNYKDEPMIFFLYGDTLSFQKHYYTGATNFEKLYIDRYDLILLKQTDTTLTVRPSSKFSKEFFYNKVNLTFIKQGFNRNTSIIFEKIIYHTTACLGTCPTIGLEIDNNRNIYLDAKFYLDMRLTPDTIMSGQFTGILNDTLYNELINLLQTCNLKTLSFPETHIYDASVTTLIIYYNGKRKYLESQSPPPIARNLILFLLSLNEKADLIKTNEKRILEKSAYTHN